MEFTVITEVAYMLHNYNQHKIMHLKENVLHCIKTSTGNMNVLKMHIC
jgi:deoxyribose-phosphate aldolase